MLICDSAEQATCVNRLCVHGWRKHATTLCRANRDIEVSLVGGGDRFGASVSQEEADHNILGLIFDGGDARIVDLIVGFAVSPEH